MLSFGPILFGRSDGEPVVNILLYACGDEILGVVEKGIECDVAYAHGSVHLVVGDAVVPDGLVGGGGKVDSEEGLIRLGRGVLDRMYE